MPNFDENTGIRYGILCGIESDSGKECFEEIVRDLKSMNKDDLLKMGFSEKEIDDSLNNAIEKEDW
jgi:hypothetical protein